MRDNAPWLMRANSKYGAGERLKERGEKVKGAGVTPDKEIIMRLLSFFSLNVWA